MQRWEIKYHWVPVDMTASEGPGRGAAKSVSFKPKWQDEFKKAWAEAESLADDGWELVSVAPETAAQMTVGQDTDTGAAVAAGVSFTAGYMLVFRRPKT